MVSTTVKSSNTLKRKRQATAPAVFLAMSVIPVGHLDKETFGLKCFLNIQVYPEPGNMTLFENRIFEDVPTMRSYWIRVDPTSND